MNRKLKIAGLISGGGTNLQALIDACANKQIYNGEFVCVGSDKLDAFGLTRAKNANIPTFILGYKEISSLAKSSPGRIHLNTPHDFKLEEALKKSDLPDTEENRKRLCIRAIVEYQLLNELKKYAVDVLVLAGFMRILSSYFLDRFQPDPAKPKVLNIHPALSPSFPGEHGYEDAYDYGVKVHGATVHYVDHRKDTGPIIDQSCYKRLQNETIESFKARGLMIEWELYVNALNLHCENRLKIITNPSGRRIVEEIPRKIFANR